MKREWFSEPAEHWFFCEGYRCELKRHAELGFLNGYIYLPTSHPDFGKCYGEVENEVSVHGGLTFSDGGKFGFDCGHAGDLIPALEHAPNPTIDTYRNMEYVELQLRRLAEQFRQRENKSMEVSKC